MLDGGCVAVCTRGAVCVVLCGLLSICENAVPSRSKFKSSQVQAVRSLSDLFEFPLPYPYPILSNSILLSHFNFIFPQ